MRYRIKEWPPAGRCGPYQKKEQHDFVASTLRVGIGFARQKFK
jgi:hypothetical protein